MSTPRNDFKLLVDADACPVTGQALQIAARFGVQVVLVCDNAHVMHKPGAQTVTVDKGADSADFALLSRVQQGDVVITGDYGLAAMALARGAHPINQDGMRYTAQNIDALLAARHTAAKVRRGGGRLRGPKARGPAQNQAFARAFEALLEQLAAGA